MRSLRSSDGYGMVIVFKSKESRRSWLSRSVLGEEVSTSDGEYGVRFRRAWTRKEFDKYLGTSDYRRGLRALDDRTTQDARPPSRNERNPVSPQPATDNSFEAKGYLETYEAAISSSRRRS